MYVAASAACLGVSVSVNEAVEIAKTFGSEEDASYINGVLSTIVKKIK